MTEDVPPLGERLIPGTDTSGKWHRRAKHPTALAVQNEITVIAAIICRMYQAHAQAHRGEGFLSRLLQDAVA